MLKLSNLIVSASAEADLRQLAVQKLHAPESDILEIKILKRSTDSRKKPNVYFVYTLAVSLKNEEKYGKYAERYEENRYAFPYEKLAVSKPVVIVGAGPAGLFAALSLTEAGVKCILLERGQPVEQRTKDVNEFWRTGKLYPESNVQFGEGGAGTFSDGKLMTGIKDMRIPYVFSRFVEFGAPEEILYLAKPHVGTDNLHVVVRNLREHLKKLGCEVRFGHKLTSIQTENNAVSGVSVSSPDGEYCIETDHLILAIGNSARDTFRMLHACGVPMSPKSFAVGVRIEHLQKDIDLAQYGEAATLGTLPAADYKLSEHLPNGRSVFTFCVCPGGTVVAAASELGRVCTNGMSENARDKENINGGLLVGVDPDDFGGTLFGGLEFQETLEEAAFRAGGGDFKAPAQTVGDLLAGRASARAGKVTPSYTAGVRFGDLGDCLPSFILDSIREALPKMERKIRGFAAPDAVLTAAETRSSSPVRIDRDENFESAILGLYPCGEGAGFAGGITSSAVDGIKCAEKLCENLK